MAMFEWGAVGFLVLVYGGSGLAELPLWRRFVDRFVKWGYPRSWAIVTPVLKIIGAALTPIPQTRPIGAALCALIGIAAAITVLRFRERALYAPALAVATLTLCGAGLLMWNFLAGFAGAN